MTNSKRRLSTALRVVLLAVIVCVAGVGCSISPNDLPSVRRGVSIDYTVTLEFANVLNLPAGADVMMNGLRVGRVTATRGREQGVDVVVGLTDDVLVPADTSAIIRQNTLLGDTYVALTPPAGSGGEAGFLTDGSVVPIQRTTSPPTLEDTIAVLAYFVNGGSIQKIQDTMATLNQTMPDVNSVRRMASTVAGDLDDLAAGTHEIDRMLVGLGNTANSFADRKAEIAAVFGEQGADYWNRVARSVVAHISTLLPSVGSIFVGGLWLIPMLKSVAETTESGRAIWDQLPDTATQLSNFLNSTLLPWAANPSVNINSVQDAAGRQLIGDATNILRMLGAVR